MKKITVFLACLAAFAMVFGFTVTAAMADADLYGSIRFRTYWVDKDKAFTGYHSSDTGFDDEDLDWQIGYLSRWGVNYQSGNIKGKLEMDTRDADGKEGSAELGDVRVRHLYGEWDFGMGKLLIGQTFSPCTVYASSIGYYSGGLQPFHGTGLSYFRTSQIRLTFDNFMIAFLTPDIDTNYGEADTDKTIPRIEARYSLKLDPLTLDFMGGYQTYDVVNSFDDDESIDSYFVGLYAQANFGAAYVKALVNYRQNGGNYGLWSGAFGDYVNEDAVYTATGNQQDVDDSDAIGYGAVVGYKFSDKFSVEASYAGSSAETDTDYYGGDPEDDVQAYALALKYSPAPGVIIQPEFIYEDQQESDFQEFNKDGTLTGNGDDQGDAFIFGVFWMINFK
ncbi:MAG: hypothetical protein WBB70_15610 [Desulfobacterales bacterium]